jgi:hypothetical protein
VSNLCLQIFFFFFGLAIILLGVVTTSQESSSFWLGVGSSADGNLPYR